jgi:LysR family transcriptional activator of nhaA
LSAQLREFEEALGRRLFDRVGRRLVLTEDGKAVLRYAEQIVRLGRELADDLRDRPPGGALSVQLGVTPGTPRAVVESLVAAALAGALRRLPRPARTSKGPGRAPRFGLLRRHPRRRGPPLAPGRAPPGSRGRPDVVGASTPAQRLGGVPLVLPKAPSAVHKQVQTYLAGNGLNVHVTAEVPDAETALRLAAAGRGVAPVDSVTLSRAKGLVAVPGGPSSLCHELWLAAAAGRMRPNPAAERLFKTFSPL